MSKFSKKFQRRKPYRLLRKTYHLFMEGKCTEPEYFNMLKRKCPFINLKLHPHSDKNDPIQLLERAEEFRKSKEFRERDCKEDQVWIIVDTDNRPKSRLTPLYQWSKNENCGLAISNPKFEFWLLSHFEKGDNISNTKECEKRLRKHGLKYEKDHIEEEKLWPRIQTAISNSEEKHKQCKDWHVDNHSTVYVLVREILDSEIL